MTLFTNVILGLPLLIWGRKLFWLFVGAVGFVTGYWLAQHYLNAQDEWVLVLVGVVLGVVGVLLSLLLQKIAVTVTGFLAGVYLVLNLIDTFHFNFGPWNWFIYILGGMIGSFLVIVVFEWALILLSSLVGAALISQTSFQMVRLEIGPRSVIFLVLLIIGIVVQYDQKQRE